MDELHGVCFAPSAHFNLAVLDDASTRLLDTLVQVFLRNDNADSRGECLDLQASVSDLSQEFLGDAYLVHWV